VKIHSKSLACASAKNWDADIPLKNLKVPFGAEKFASTKKLHSFAGVYEKAATFWDCPFWLQRSADRVHSSNRLQLAHKIIVRIFVRTPEVISHSAYKLYR
jgi:hypothetical protein